VTRTLAAFGLALAAIAGCSPPLPPRYVVESDFEPYTYRRFQKVLDVEFPLEGNPAEGYTAVYVDRSGDTPRMATAFVTVYDRPEALTAEIRDRLEDLGTYDVAVARLHGDYVWSLEGDDGERWLLWVSGRFLVKLGAVGSEIPDPLAKRYLALYDSDLGSDGRARSGTASEGQSEQQREESQPLDLPSNLREGAPR